MRGRINLLLAAVIFTPALVHGDEPRRDPLFHIERSKNANIVQYDAQLGSNGMLHSKTPVVGYWVRHAHEGEIKELTWVQRKFAYGFKVKLNKKENTARMDMVADLGRSIMIKQDRDDYRAIADIDGVESYIDKLFIHSTGSGTSTKVAYIDLYGTAVSNQAEQYERIIP